MFICITYVYQYVQKILWAVLVFVFKGKEWWMNPKRKKTYLDQSNEYQQT